LNEAAGLTSDEPDATVVLPGTTQRRDARVHFDDEQGQEVDTVGTGQQEQIETNSQSESSEDTASGDDELEILKQQLAVKDYKEKVLKELTRRENWQRLIFIIGSWLTNLARRKTRISNCQGS
jgi:hypothetical protein